MSAPGVTPGPWIVKDDGGGPYVEAMRHPHTVLAHAIEPFGKAEATRNAHLIAASPDLYAALEAMCAEMGIEDTDSGQAGLLALAKARGEKL